MVTPGTPAPQRAPLNSFPTLDANANHLERLLNNTVPPWRFSSIFKKLFRNSNAHTGQRITVQPGLTHQPPKNLQQSFHLEPRRYCLNFKWWSEVPPDLLEKSPLVQPPASFPPNPQLPGSQRPANRSPPQIRHTQLGMLLTLPGRLPLAPLTLAKPIYPSTNPPRMALLSLIPHLDPSQNHPRAVSGSYTQGPGSTHPGN